MVSTDIWASVTDGIADHHRIGRLVLQRSNLENRSDNLFYIVNQLNVAQELIDSEAERLELIQLNLQAGVKARSSAAYQPAFIYLQVALGLLESDAWRTRLLLM